jgi:neutral ceramidase
MTKQQSVVVAAGFLLAGLAAAQPARAQSHWKAGVATVDITPQEPIWMAGYGNRTKPSEGVLQKIYAMALVL